MCTVPRPKMRNFFMPGAVADALYSKLRNAPNSAEGVDHERSEYLNRAHQFIEQIWSTTSEYVDTNAPLKARSDLMPVFWEMYLAHALLKNGIVLAPRAKRRLVKNKGPDFATLSPAVSIEAVMPRKWFWAGQNPTTANRPCIRCPPRTNDAPPSLSNRL